MSKAKICDIPVCRLPLLVGFTRIQAALLSPSAGSIRPSVGPVIISILIVAARRCAAASRHQSRAESQGRERDERQRKKGRETHTHDKVTIRPWEFQQENRTTSVRKERMFEHPILSQPRYVVFGITGKIPWLNEKLIP